MYVIHLKSSLTYKTLLIQIWICSVIAQQVQAVVLLQVEVQALVVFYYHVQLQ